MFFLLVIKCSPTVYAIWRNYNSFNCVREKIETLDMFSLFPYFVNRLQPVNSSNLPNTVRYQLDCIAEFINSPFNEDSHEIL